MASAMASSSTTVDLSSLTAPTVIEQLDFETILAALVAAVQAALPTFNATVDSDPAVKVLQIAAYREQLLRKAFQDAAIQLLVAYATGDTLDHLGALFGVARLLITAADDATGAAAVYEDDNSFRQRIVLAPESFSVAGPELAYVYHAKSVSTAILDASATSPAPGEILVSLLSSERDDGAASAELVAAVAAVLTPVAGNKIRPMGDLVTVASAEIVPYEVTAALTTFAGPDTALLLTTARAALDSYIAGSRLLGRDITRAGIIAALRVEGVQDVELTAPGANIVCSETQAAYCTAITLTFGGYA